MPLTPTSYGQIHGNDPTKGGRQGGNIPDTMRARFDRLLKREQTMKEVERVLSDGDHKHFARVLDTALDRAEGKVPQGIDVTSGGKSVQGVVILPQQDQVPATPPSAQLPPESEPAE